MNTELFISRRLFFDKTNKKFLSHRIIRIALLSIALGLAVMIVSVAVVTGFKKEIRNKVIGFGSHIQIVNFDSNNSYETSPVSQSQPFLEKLRNIEGAKTVQVYATKPGMIKTDEYFQGIVFKGVDTKYNWNFFIQNLKEGRLPAINDAVRTNEIILSQSVCQLLNLKLDDLIIVYFINENEKRPLMNICPECGMPDVYYGECCNCGWIEDD